MKKKYDKEVVEVLLPLISEASGVEQSVILSTSRLRMVTVCRFILFRYLFEELGWSTPRIGRAFHKEHATVIHGIDRAKDFITLPSYETERAIHDDFIERVMIHENEQ